MGLEVRVWARARIRVRVRVRVGLGLGLGLEFEVRAWVRGRVRVRVRVRVWVRGWVRVRVLSAWLVLPLRPAGPHTHTHLAHATPRLVQLCRQPVAKMHAAQPG